MAEEIAVGGITVTLSHAGKVLFPDDGIAKKDLAIEWRSREVFATMTFLAVVLVLALAGVLGCAIPARRALRVDPVVALRHE